MGVSEKAYITQAFLNDWGRHVVQRPTVAQIRTDNVNRHLTSHQWG